MICLCVSPVFAQLRIPELSPSGRVIQNVGFTRIEIYYERPAARGRTTDSIFGGLVPYGKVWRTGAGNCTTIAFSKEVTINSTRIPAGKYAVFSIPNHDKWTIILNRDTLAYGSYRYDQKKDVVRVDAVPVNTNRFYESLTFDIDVVPNDARIFISWLNTQVYFGVNTGTDEVITRYINDKVISMESKNADDYEAAFNYYLWHNNDPGQIMKFVNKGISLRDDRIWYYWKIEELMRQRKFDEATEAARAAIRVIQRSDESPERKKELIADFDNYLEAIKKSK